MSISVPVLEKEREKESQDCDHLRCPEGIKPGAAPLMMAKIEFVESEAFPILHKIAILSKAECDLDCLQFSITRIFLVDYGALSCQGQIHT